MKAHWYIYEITNCKTGKTYIGLYKCKDKDDSMKGHHHDRENRKSFFESIKAYFRRKK